MEGVDGSEQARVAQRAKDLECAVQRLRRAREKRERRSPTLSAEIKISRTNLGAHLQRDHSLQGRRDLKSGSSDLNYNTAAARM